MECWTVCLRAKRIIAGSIPVSLILNFKGGPMAKERKAEAERLIEREVILMTPDFKDKYHAMVDAITDEPTDGSKRKVNVSTHIRSMLEGELALYESCKEK
jgi:hypothetical protein